MAITLEPRHKFKITMANNNMTTSTVTEWQHKTADTMNQKRQFVNVQFRQRHDAVSLNPTDRAVITKQEEEEEGK